MTLVQTAHFWTKIHPKLEIEEDIKDLLSTNESLAECLFDDSMIASFGLSFWLALFAGVVIASVAGAVLGLTSLRLGGHYLAMVTISFQQILTLMLIHWTSFTRGPDGIPGIARPMVFGFSFADSGTYLALCVGVIWVVGFCVGRLKHSKLGRAMQALRDNELAAGVLGVDTYGLK
jgi:branched-chain amino acid transport system permease protein